MVLKVGTAKSSKQVLYDNSNDINIYKDIISYLSYIINENGLVNKSVYNLDLFYNYKDNKLQKFGELGKTFYIDNFNINRYLRNKKLNELILTNNITDDLDGEFALFIKEKILTKSIKKVASICDDKFNNYRLKFGYKALDEFSDCEFTELASDNVIGNVNKYSSTITKLPKSTFNSKLEYFKEQVKTSTDLPDEFNHYIDEFLDNTANTSLEDIIRSCSYNMQSVKSRIIEIDDLLNYYSSLFDEIIDDPECYIPGLNFISMEMFSDSEILKIEELFSKYFKNNKTLMKKVANSNLLQTIKDITVFLPKDCYINDSDVKDLPNELLFNIKDINVVLSNCLDPRIGYNNYSETGFFINTNLLKTIKDISKSNKIYMVEENLNILKGFINMYNKIARKQLEQTFDISFINVISENDFKKIDFN